MSKKVVKKKLSDLPVYSNQLNQGTVFYTENGLAYQYPINNIVLISNLNDPDGSLLIGSPENIDALRQINPGAPAKITTLGALSRYDGGGDTWVFDDTDMSALVSTYPKLFIPPNSDTSGKSGAWKLSWNIIGHRAKAYGVGIGGSKNHNTDTLNQLMRYNNQIQWIQLPGEEIQVIALYYPGNPKLSGVPGVNSDISTSHVTGSLENGTVLISRDIDSSEPVLRLAGTPNLRLGGGIDLINLAIISGDLIDHRDLSINPEWQVRSSRVALKLEYITSKVNVYNVTIFGFVRAHYFNEVWDGSVRESAIGICSDINGSVPAVYLGSDNTDNTNNLTYIDTRIEHCPWSLELGAVNHVRFIGCKIETKRAQDATNYVIKVNPTAISYTFSACMFVTTTATQTHYLYDQGQRPIYDSCHFTGGGIVGYYPGIRWIYRNPTGTSNAIFKAIKITEAYQADGTDATKYPIYLADYDQLDGSISCEDAYTINGVSVNPTNQGIISVGTGTKIGALHIHTNNITKNLGSIFYARSGDYNLGELSISGTAYRLLSGNAVGNIISNGAKTTITSSGDLQIYGKETIVFSTTTTLTALTGFTGQIIRLISFAGGSIISQNSRITTTSGTPLTMTANTVYTFFMLSQTTAKQIA